MDPLIVPAEWFVAAILVGVGLSHVLNPALWARLIDDMARAPHLALIAGLAALALGAAVVIAHNRWTLAPTLLVTLIGWAWVLKGLVYLLAPGTLGAIARGRARSPATIRVLGLVCIVLGLFAAASAAGLFVAPA